HGARDLLRLHQNLADHRLRTFNIAGAFAIRARRAQRTLQALLHTFARDGHESEIVELENLVGSAVRAHALFKRLHHLLAILALVHVDEVHHDDAAEVAQADLPHDFPDG